MKHEEILDDTALSQLLLWGKKDLRYGDWVYTPDAVFTAGTRHNVFQYDPRINYSLHFGHQPKFYKLCVNTEQKG